MSASPSHCPRPCASVTTAVLWLLSLLLGSPSFAQAQDRESAGRGAAGAGHGAVWVVVPGQSRRLTRLVEPHSPGTEVTAGWVLERVEVAQDGWSYVLAGPVGSPLDRCQLAARLGGSDWADHPEVAWTTTPPHESLPDGAKGAINALRSAAAPRVNAVLLGRISALRGERGPPPPADGLTASAGGRGLSPDLAAWLALLLAAVGVGLAAGRWRKRADAPASWSALVVEWAPAALLLVGLGLRFRGVPLAEFAADEVGFFETTQRLVLDGRWPVLGPQISGGDTYHPGGLFYWIMAIPAALGRDPRLAGLFTAGVSIAGLALTTRMVKQTRGRAAAIVFAWLAALSPWFVVHGDRLDNSSVSVWLGAVALYGLHRMHVRPRSRWVAGVIIVLAVLPQLHLSAPVLWGVALGQLLLWRPSIHWRAASAGLGVAVLLSAPYLVWEATHGLSNTLGLLGAVTETDAGQESPLMSALAYLFVMGTGHVDYLFQHEYAQLADVGILWQVGTGEGRLDSWARYGPWVSVLIVASMLVAATGWARGLGRAFERRPDALRLRNDPAFTALLLGGLTALVLLGWRDQRVYPHYVNLLLPVAIVPLVDGLLAPLALARPTWARGLIATLVVVTGVTFGALSVRYYDQVEAPAGVAATIGVAEQITARQQQTPFQWVSDRPTPDGLRAVAGFVLAAPWPERSDAPVKYRAVVGPSTAPDDRRWWIPPVWLEELPR